MGIVSKKDDNYNISKTVQLIVKTKLFPIENGVQ